MIRKILSLLLAVLLLAAAAGCGTVADPPDPDAMPIKDLVAAMEDALSAGYDDYEVSVKGKEITASIWKDGFALELTRAVDAGYPRVRLRWTYTVEQLVYLAEEMQDFVESVGHEDKTVTLELLNDTNLDRTFLVIRNGEVLYDVIEEKESK